MAVEIYKRFHAWSAKEDCYKIVFTSPYFTNGSPIGTRSHILPGSDAIGTWYEGASNMYRKSWNQNYDVSSTQPTYFQKLYVGNTYYNLNNSDSLYTSIAEETISGTGKLLIFHKYPLDLFVDVNEDIHDLKFYYDKDSYITLSSTTTCAPSYNITHEIDGETYYYTVLQYLSSVGSTTLSGSSITLSGSDVLYTWPNYVSTWANESNSVQFQLNFGEAYNCRLTAWDDITHSTTNNKILSEGHYKATCCAFYSGTHAYYDVTGYSPFKTFNVSSDYYVAASSLFIHPPAEDIVLKGNDSYYGDFNMFYMAGGGPEEDLSGAYLIFRPRLANMDESFTSGNYDFVTTLHYQYT